MPVKFSFLAGSSGEGLADDPNEPVHIVLGETEFDISPNAARNIACVIAVVLLIPAIIGFFMVPMVSTQKQALLDDVNNKLQQTNAEITRLQEEQNKQGGFDLNAEIKKVLTNNRSKLMAYTALGEAVPKKLWVTYFVAKDDGKFDIKGDSSNVEDIYLFFRNMKDSLISTKLRLHKLEMKSDSVDDAVTIDPNQPTDYEFEVTNMTSAELNPPPPPSENTQQNEKVEDDKNKSGGLLNKPLLNFGKENK